MVREKRKRKKVEGDFKKAKYKVGRRISKKEASKYNNVVDTTVRSKELNIKNQQNSDEKVSDLDNVKNLALNIAKYLPLTDHHNKNTRKAAFDSICKDLSASFATGAGKFPKEFLSPVMSKIRVGFLDTEVIVRESNLNLMKVVFNLKNGIGVSAFLNQIVLQLIVGISSLSRGVRRTSLQALDFLFSQESILFSILDEHFDKILDVLIVTYGLTLQIIGVKTKILRTHFQVMTNLLYHFLLYVETNNASLMPRYIKSQNIDWSSKEFTLRKTKCFIEEYEIKKDIVLDKKVHQNLLKKTNQFSSLAKTRGFPVVSIKTVKIVDLLKKLSPIAV